MNGFFDDQKGSLDDVCEDAHKDDAEECPSHVFSGILVTLRVVRESDKYVEVGTDQELIEHNELVFKFLNEGLPKHYSYLDKERLKEDQVDLKAIVVS